jgi:phosphoribosylanthranilate isomerase
LHVAGVKICGLSTVEAVRAALDGRATHIGFMFFANSPRNIAADAAARLAQPVRGKAKVVAVTVDPDDDLVDELTRALQPDLIQLHGRETPARARQIAVRSGAGVIKTIPVTDSLDIERARQFEGAAEHLMFEGKPPPESDRPGGVGASFDWSLLIGARFQRPWFLAGGLDPWNVTEAVRLSGAPMVDVSSGVERGPGLKDPALITAFLEAVRRA